MESRIPLADGNSIPALGVGTFEQEGQLCTDVVRWALEMGYKAIDHAEAYWNSKEVAAGLKAVPREEFFLTTKLWRPDLPRDKVAPAIDKLISELDCDYLDLLLIHWPDHDIPIGETLEEMEKAKQAGKVRSLGVCNSTIRHIKDVLATGIQIVTNQVEYHPYLDQSELQAFCEANGIRVTAYSPLARGEALKDPVLTEIGARYGKSPAQVALRWAHQRGCIVIFKTSTKERLKSNGEIFDFELTEEEMKQIAGLSRNLRTILPDFNEFDYA
jgi:2,5-diketo-D-gluconate reductase B